MPDLAVIVPCVVSIPRLVKSQGHRPQDPWGLEYTKQNTAGGGAYKVTRWQPGTEVAYERNETWTSGEPRASFSRAHW